MFWLLWVILVGLIAGWAAGTFTFFTPLLLKTAGHGLSLGQVGLLSAVPYIVTGMRVAMASSFMSIIPAEILAADSGIGYLLQKSSLLLQTNRIFVALLTICILGFVVDRIFRFLVERVLTRYMSYVSVT